MSGISPTGSRAHGVKRAIIAASSSGATTVVAAVPGKKLRVIACCVIANSAVNVKFQSHTANTDISGVHYLPANGGFVLPKVEEGWFETLSGEALDVNLSGAVTVGGELLYVEA